MNGGSVSPEAALAKEAFCQIALLQPLQSDDQSSFPHAELFTDEKFFAGVVAVGSSVLRYMAYQLEVSSDALSELLQNVCFAAHAVLKAHIPAPFKEADYDATGIGDHIRNNGDAALPKYIIAISRRRIVCPF